MSCFHHETCCYYQTTAQAEVLFRHRYHFMMWAILKNQQKSNNRFKSEINVAVLLSQMPYVPHTQLTRRAHVDPLVSGHDDFRREVERDFARARRQMDRDITAAVISPRFDSRPIGSSYTSSYPHHSLSTAQSASSTSHHASSRVSVAMMNQSSCYYSLHPQWFISCSTETNN